MYQIIHYLDENENDIYQSWLDFEIGQQRLRLSVVLLVLSLDYLATASHCGMEYLN
jgi:hypothetical protein